MFKFGAKDSVSGFQFDLMFISGVSRAFLVKVQWLTMSHLSLIKETFLNCWMYLVCIICLKCHIIHVPVCSVPHRYTAQKKNSNEQWVVRKRIKRRVYTKHKFHCIVNDDDDDVNIHAQTQMQMPNQCLSHSFTVSPCRPFCCALKRLSVSLGCAATI